MANQDVTVPSTIGFPSLLHTFVVLLNAAVLLTAAILKSYFLTIEAGGDITQEQGSGLLLSSIEFSLGLWLLSGIARRHSLLACTFWFAVCVLWSVLNWLSGSRTCGCAGRIEISPLLSLAASFILLLSLIAIQRFSVAKPSTKGELARMRLALCVFSQVSVLIYISTFFIVGSPRWVLAYFEESPIVIVPSRVEIGACASGDTRVVKVEIKNVTVREVKIQSIQTDCACTTLIDPPGHLAPGEIVAIDVRVRCVGNPQAGFHQQIRVYAVDGGLHTVPVVCGCLTPPP